MSAEMLGPSEGALSRKRVLLAEDDEVNQEIVRALLETVAGVELTVVPDGRAALEAAMTRKFDLLIVDRKMPLISGEKLIRHLRASANPNAATFTILFSASTASELKELIGSCPADEVMTKPIRPKPFVARLRTILGIPEEEPA
ncbi:response regulator [Actibacterium sp. MT2.3-13A]|uniref:response regulator n=1 Tax=Actibacterium sp. MT2.3-13A TaxID=2828332 RepID=UPI001BADE80A|nr:response regulator [Actibacterium sp. MT2.3-13A]